MTCPPEILTKFPRLTVSAMREEMMRQFWADAEEVGLALLAAGIPLDQIGFKNPQVVTEGMTVKIVGGIYFNY